MSCWKFCWNKNTGLAWSAPAKISLTWVESEIFFQRTSYHHFAYLELPAIGICIFSLLAQQKKIAKILNNYNHSQILSRFIIDLSPYLSGMVSRIICQSYSWKLPETLKNNNNMSDPGTGLNVKMEISLFGERVQCCQWRSQCRHG